MGLMAVGIVTFCAVGPESARDAFISPFVRTRSRPRRPRWNGCGGSCRRCCKHRRH